MNKILLISLAAILSLVSQGLAASCNVYCQYATGCFEQSTEHSDAGTTCTHPNCTCAQLAAHCANVGGEYTGVTGLNSGNNYGEGVNCKANGGTWTGNGQNPNTVGALGYCDWGPCDCNPDDDYSCTDGGCFEIKNEEEKADCEAYKTPLTSLSQCPTASKAKADGGTCGGSSPIRPDQKLETSQFGLTVIPQAGSLLISSLREATVSLFDMRGQQVFSQEVAAGYSTLSLNGQKQGVYYAVVSSGSSKQTVKVVLK